MAPGTLAAGTVLHCKDRKPAAVVRPLGATSTTGHQTPVRVSTFVRPQVPEIPRQTTVFEQNLHSLASTPTRYGQFPHVVEALDPRRSPAQRDPDLRKATCQLAMFAVGGVVVAYGDDLVPGRVEPNSPQLGLPVGSTHAASEAQLDVTQRLRTTLHVAGNVERRVRELNLQQRCCERSVAVCASLVNMRVEPVPTIGVHYDGNG